MKKIQTRDGSFTFFNEKFGETYHASTVGALEESRIKYAEPANIKEGDCVLDFCFGLGYNTIAALKICKKITITAIEFDKNILDEAITNIVPEDYSTESKIIIKAVQDSFNKQENSQIKIIIGKAENEIKQLSDNTFNCVLFDPFSPSKHKELWSLDVFKNCFRLMKKGGRLTTYSCATWIRNNMREAGFKVIDGPIFGRKSASTIAIKE